MIALGEKTAGVFGNDDNLIKNLIKSGNHYSEQIWHMPIFKEHIKNIEGNVADISNSGKSRYGGASSAAAFLQKFVDKDVKWAHLDIAGPAMSKGDNEQFSKGGTAFGVQTLTKFITNQAYEEN